MNHTPTQEEEFKLFEIRLPMRFLPLKNTQVTEGMEIVKRLDAHDDLLEACKQARFRMMFEHGEIKESEVLTVQQVFDLLSKAIAKAGVK